MITILADTIYEKVEEFASYEAGRGVEDESLYKTITVTSRDKVFLNSFASDALLLIGGLLNFCLEDYGFDEEGNYTYLFRDDCILSRKEKRTAKHLTEAMTSYVMSRWLSNKLPEKAKAYASMYTDMASIIVNSAERIRPTLKDQ